jgi:hypothetical protein
MKIPCDVCGEEVEDDVSAWREHNHANYIRHVHLSTQSHAEAIRIFQGYLEGHPDNDLVREHVQQLLGGT